jgi:hypothetical protein
MRPLETERKTTLTTPSRGVQQWRDDECQGTTRIAWATTGSRGLPRTLIMLPVVPVYWRDGLRWVPPPTLMKELEGDPDKFWSTYPLRESLDSLGEPRHLAKPRARCVRDDCGKRWDAYHLVVLLDYDESPGIGEPEDSHGLAGNGHLHAGDGHRDETRYRAEISRIREFFNEGYQSRLVIRGLVRLPALNPPAKTGEFVFALASCQYPADMTDGAPNDHEAPEAPSSASMLRLSRLLTPMTPASPSLLLLVGDQVYVDATAGICDVRSQSDRLRLPYENLLASPGAQSVFGLLPVAMMLDDHELVNNWEPGIVIDAGDAAPRQLVPPTPEQIEKATKKRIKKGKAAYRRFQRMAGPPLRNNSALWCTFTQSGVPFFIADTRTERRTPDITSRRVDNWRQARIMGREQWSALREFLLKHRQEVSFVVSPSMLLPRRLGLGCEPSLALEHDAWDGFPASMHDLLAFVCKHELNRVVFLSGDAHTSCVVRATVTNGTHSATFWSVHSSGLYTPYPFANDIRENYADEEVFHFRLSEDCAGGPATTYRCKVERAEFFRGDGFAVLTLTHTGAHSRVLQVRFNRAGCDSGHAGCNSARAGCNLEGSLIHL